MELCTKVQAEDYVVHVVGSTSFYTHLQFSLLASTWFPRPLGVCLWSVLHMLLLLYEALILLVSLAIVFALAVLMDALCVSFVIYGVLLTLSGVITVVLAGFLFTSIIAALVLVWLVITWQCRTKPPQSQDPQPAPVVEGGAASDGPPKPPQSQDTQPAPVVEGGAASDGPPKPPQSQDTQPAPVVEGRAASDGPCGFLKRGCRGSFTLKFVNHVILESFPYRRKKLGDLCQEIVLRYDIIVI